MLNRLDVNHQCDRQMDGRTDDSNSMRLTARAKTTLYPYPYTDLSVTQYCVSAPRCQLFATAGIKVTGTVYSISQKACGCVWHVEPRTPRKLRL